MARPDILNYAKLRLAVGRLGESVDPPWWHAAFFSSESDAFLTPVFPRTQWLTRMTATSEAAARIHDEHLGVGRVFHLFRLPETFEQQIAESAKSNNFVEEMAPLMGDADGARSFLEQLATGHETIEGTGPVRLGTPDDLDIRDILATMAGAYRHAFEKEIRIYPFVSDRDT